MDSTGITPVMPVGSMDGGFGSGSAFFWIFALLILAGGGFGFSGYGNRNTDVATKDFVTDSINNQTTQASLQNLLLSSANNN